MSNLKQKQINFFKLTKQSSKSERITQLKKILLSLGLKYKPEESSNNIRELNERGK